MLRKLHMYQVDLTFTLCRCRVISDRRCARDSTRRTSSSLNNFGNEQILLMKLILTKEKCLTVPVMLYKEAALLKIKKI